LAQPPQKVQHRTDRPPPTPFTKNAEPKSKEDHSGTEKRRSTWLERLAVVFAALAACALGYQGWIARDAEHRELRAYIGIIPGGVENFGQPGQRAIFIRKNYGATPAYDVGFSEGGFIIQAVGARLPAAPKGCVAPGMPLITMFPGAELPLTINFEGRFTGEAILSVLAGKSVLIYFGNACYHDAFGSVHYTNYCWMYKGASTTAKDADACLGYNDSN
jgi:hypothetical protein